MQNRRGETPRIVKIPESPTWWFFFLWRKNTGLLRFTSLCRSARGLIVWENNLGKWKREGGKKVGRFSCCACSLQGYQAGRTRKSASYSPAPPLMGAQRKAGGKKKTGLLIRCRVIFCLVVELLTGVSWRGKRREEGSEAE